MRTPRITYANTMATIALCLAVSGTAYAATVITGANVKDGSLTSLDVKAASLTAADLAKSAGPKFVGDTGNTGTTGAKGATGLAGPDGPQGPRGSAAFMTSTFAFRDTGLVTQRTNSLTPNDGAGSTGHDWDDPNYASQVGGFSNIRPAGSYNQVNLTAAMQPVVSFTGMSGADLTRSNPSLLKLTFTEGYLNATATLTLLHRRDGESLADHTGGTLRHGRVTCALFYGTSADPNQLTQMAGTAAYASSGTTVINTSPVSRATQDHELVQVSLNGNASNMVAGTQYNVTVKCRDADFTGNTQWQLATGNLTSFISR